MAIEQRLERSWQESFAARTRGDVGAGLASILALANATDLISFSGGFPDPVTFPRGVLVELLQALVASGESAAFQYAPTRGLPGPLAFLADRLETREGRRPADDELMITSGGIE